MKQKLIAKVTSLSDLRIKAARDEQYAKLLVIAASNLGGPSSLHLNFPTSPKMQSIAYQWLVMNANETNERGVVAEVNACRDLIS